MGGHATGGGVVFSVGWSVYNRVLRKKLIGLFCGGEAQIRIWECFPIESLRLLSDQLYWSACERVTPIFSISFAVDGW